MGGLPFNKATQIIRKTKTHTDTRRTPSEGNTKNPEDSILTERQRDVVSQRVSLLLKTVEEGFCNNRMGKRRPHIALKDARRSLASKKGLQSSSDYYRESLSASRRSSHLEKEGE